MNNDTHNSGPTFTDVQPPKPPADDSINADKAFSDDVHIPPSPALAQPPAEAEVNASDEDSPFNDRPADHPATEQKTATEQTSQPSRKAPKRPVPVVVISLAVLVAAGLSAAAIYGYRQSAEPAEQPTAATEMPADTLSGSAEVDSVMTEIDTSIDSLSEAADFPEAEISDQNLGL